MSEASLQPHSAPTDPSSRKAWTLRVALLCAGVLAGCLIFLTRLPATDLPLGQQILGDEGDGLLTLWIAEHVRLSLAAGSLSDPVQLADRLADGRIFWPENEDSYYWTAPLFVPGLLHSLLVSLGATPIASFLLTSMAAFALGICALALTFWCFADEVCPGLHPGWGVLFAVATALSPSTGIYFIHPQNPWGLVWVGLVAVPVLLRRGRCATAAAVVGASLFVFISTTPYFFVMAVAYLAFVAALTFRELPVRALLRSYAAWSWLALFAVPSLYFALHLSRVVALGTTTQTVRELSSDLWHFVTPAMFASVLWEPWRDLGLVTRFVSHESPAYLGVAGIPALLFAFGWTARRTPRWLWAAALIPLVWNATSIDVAAVRWTVAVLLAVLFGHAAQRMLAERPGSGAFSALNLVLVSFFFLFFLSLGPQARKLPEGALDASAWGILAQVVPGFATMRAIGRFSVLAKCLLFLWATLASLLWIQARAARGASTVLWSGALAAMLALVALEAQVPLYGMQVQPEDLELRPEETEALARELHGVAAIFPVGPDHENAKWMLRFRELPDVALVNGYSSKVSQLWQHVREVQSDPAEQPSAEEARRLCEAGVDRLVRAGSPERAAGDRSWQPVPGGRFWIASCRPTGE